MKSWLLRGLVFAALMVVMRLVQAAMINTWETQALLISVFLLTIFTVLALAWGLIDGRNDAAAEPDPDRRADLAMTWLLAGLVAGFLSGLVAWIISLFVKSLYIEGLINEVTTYAAFTALLTFVAAIIGVTIGRWWTDRQAARRGTPSGRHYRAEGEDTDVFAAVGGGETQAEATEGQPTQAPAGRSEPTPTERSENEATPTDRFRTQTEGGDERR